VVREAVFGGPPVSSWGGELVHVKRRSTAVPWITLAASVTSWNGEGSGWSGEGRGGRWRNSGGCGRPLQCLSAEKIETRRISA
jgi:hypothetical protein